MAQDSSDAAWQLTLRLSQVKRQAAMALQELPDFTCLATYDRYLWPVNQREEKKLDTVRVEVAYVGGRELYSWPGENKFSDTPLSSMVGAGMMGDGEYAVHAHNIFVGDNGVLKWAGEEDSAGLFAATRGKFWRWDYQISVYQSGWSVQSGMARQNVGSEGSFWVDAVTHDLVRLETHATDFIPGFPLKAVTSWVEYGRVRIGEQNALLPLRAELKTVAQNGSESRNLTEYTNCRQYAGQSTISFGIPLEEKPPAASLAPEPLKDGRLRAGIAIQIRLSQDIKTAAAKVGDAVEDVLTVPLRDGKEEIAPKGAAVHGRVRLLTRDTTAGKLPGEPEPFTELGLVFDELEFAGHRYRFDARLKSFDTAVPGVLMRMVRETSENGVITKSEFGPTNMPGISAFFVDKRNTGLPKGTLMTWVTEP